MIGIYKITNPKGKVYVGQSVELEKRRLTYNRGKDIKSQVKLYSSILKYGWESHSFEVIEECLEEELNTRERHWQDFYDVLKKGLNCKLTKTGDKSGRMSDSAKRKISKANKGRKNTGQRLENLKSYMKKAYDKLKKPVQVFSYDGILIAEYESLNEAHRQTGFSMTTITKSIKGLTKKNRYGKWKYKC